MKKALIAVELFERGGPTCLNETGGFCQLVNICYEREHYRPLPSCPLRTSTADAAVTEAERILTDTLEGGYCTVRLKRALEALKKARE